jgi:hypothetical protein
MVFTHHVVLLFIWMGGFSMLPSIVVPEWTLWAIGCVPVVIIIVTVFTHHVVLLFIWTARFSM